MARVTGKFGRQGAIRDALRAMTLSGGGSGTSGGGSTTPPPSSGMEIEIDTTYGPVNALRFIDAVDAYIAHYISGQTSAAGGVDAWHIVHNRAGGDTRWLLEVGNDNPGGTGRVAELSEIYMGAFCTGQTVEIVAQADPGGANVWYVATRLNYFELSETATTINGGARDIDTIIKGDTDAELVYVDAGNDRVGISTNAPEEKFTVDGVHLAKDKIAFTQTDLNEYIDSLNDGYMDYGATTAHRFNADVKLPGDSRKVILGAGDDMSVYYDGTNGNIDTDLVAASDLTIDCGTDKTVVLEESVWDDLRVVPGSFDRPGLSDPTIVAYTPTGSGTGSYLYQFAKNNLASFTVQMPHTYKTGTDIYCHIHWTPGPNGAAESGNTVGWKVDYTWASINSAFGAMATLDLSDACDGTDDKHQMTPEAAITGTGKGISSMLICNVKRTDTGADDTWTGTASGDLPMLLEIDFHFEIDTLGSRQISAK